MEFLVRIDVRLPSELPDDARNDLTAAESTRGRELQEAGSIVRIWRVPGRHANVGVWQAADASELHDLLLSLPLFRFMDIDVQALAVHPLEVSRIRSSSP